MKVFKNCIVYFSMIQIIYISYLNKTFFKQVALIKKKINYKKNRYETFIKNKVTYDIIKQAMT